MFEHTTKKGWQKKRQKRWDDHHIYNFDEYAKKDRKLIEAYFLTGDVEAFVAGMLKSKASFRFFDFLELTPANTQQELDYVMAYVLENYYSVRIPEYTKGDIDQYKANLNEELNDFLDFLIIRLPKEKK